MAQDLSLGPHFLESIVSIWSLFQSSDLEKVDWKLYWEVLTTHQYRAPGATEVLTLSVPAAGQNRLIRSFHYSSAFHSRVFSSASCLFMFCRLVKNQNSGFHFVVSSEAGVSGNDFWTFGNGNGSAHSQTLGTGMRNFIPNFWEREREWKFHSRISGPGMRCCYSREWPGTGREWHRKI